MGRGCEEMGQQGLRSPKLAGWEARKWVSSVEGPVSKYKVKGLERWLNG